MVCTNNDDNQKMDTVAKRRLGLEQEFFLVNPEGELINKADQFLQGCHEVAETRNRPHTCFAPEFVKSIVEINTLPVTNVEELRQEYLEILQILLKVARDLNLRLYSLSTYPLHTMPVVRNKPEYHLQVRTVGEERFANAARCLGTHLHLELPPGTIDRRVGISYQSTRSARSRTLDLHNLLTALDPALIALSRACPFYEGKVTGKATRTMHYRGSAYYGWEGVYAHLQPVGGLLPYAETVQDLVEQQFHRYYTWLEAMDQAGVERDLFLNTGGELLTAGWNPLRLNKLGTLELRGIDSNYPQVVLALVDLVVTLVQRVREENLTVRPQPDLKVFMQQGQTLYVPDFKYLNGELFYQAVTEGIESQDIQSYLDSILEFATFDGRPTLARFKEQLGNYRTTEAELLEQFTPATEELSREEGLKVVRYCCDQFEAQVQNLDQQTTAQTLLKINS
jgi:gamma-glutamyl:cysteine ligase YbdK (ATP-grasp superfamily)